MFEGLRDGWRDEEVSTSERVEHNTRGAHRFCVRKTVPFSFVCSKSAASRMRNCGVVRASSGRGVIVCREKGGAAGSVSTDSQPPRESYAPLHCSGAP